jgi:hypothetical protein
MFKEARATQLPREKGMEPVREFEETLRVVNF